MCAHPNPFPHLVFVHGTLMRGENDYIYWLANPNECLFVGTATTSRRYPFFATLLPAFPDCSPCLLYTPDASINCRHIQGELFLVTDKMLSWLDIFHRTKERRHKSVPIQVISHVLRSQTLLKNQYLIHPFVEKPPSPRPEQEVGVLLRAICYFRSKDFPEDWDSTCPRSSTALLSSFSAGLMLNTYASRFSGRPAHFLTKDTGSSLQLALNSLPKEFHPPSTIAGETGYGAPFFPAPIVLFIIDGIADNTYPELGNRTPLEVVAGVAPRCFTPQSQLGVPTCHMPRILGIEDTSLEQQDNKYRSPGINCITRSGVSGLMDPYLSGVSCGSDTAHLSMFGYDVPVYYRGRGALEALGAGLDLDDGDIAFKSNFATFADPSEGGFGDEDAELELEVSSQSTNGQHYVTHRRCDMDFTREGPILCEALDGTTVGYDLEGKSFDYEHVIHVKYAIEHRCAVALTGAKRIAIPPFNTGGASKERLIGELSDKITGTDCLRDRRLLLRCEPTVGPEDPEYEAARYTSRLVEAASVKLSELLKSHAVNVERRAHNRRVHATQEPRKNLANLILLRGAAKKGWMPSFLIRHGLHGVILAPTCIIKGIGICCGLASAICDLCFPPLVVQRRLCAGGGVSIRHPMEGATGDCNSNLNVKVKSVLHTLRLECPALHADPNHLSTVLDAVKQAEHSCSQGFSFSLNPHYNFAVVHIKGVDEASHDRSIVKKLQLLQRCGIAMQQIWDRLPPGATMAVVGDHSTPIAIGDHSCEPVPVSVATKTFSVPPASNHSSQRSEVRETIRECNDFAFHDDVECYSEVLACEGGLGHFRGLSLLPLLKRANTYYHYREYI